MKEFTSFEAFALHLAKVSASLPGHLYQVVDESALMIDQAAKAEIGTYQRDNMGPFDEWLELVPDTKKDRVRKGYTENDPLLRSGEMKRSIEHQTKGLEAEVGSNSDIMVYQEFGTEKIPPRSVLGLAAFRSEEKIHQLVGDVAMAVLSGHE